MRALVRAHRWLYANRDGSIEIAVAASRIPAHYASRAFDEYTRERIFPPDGDVSTAGVQALIDISATIRALPGRRDMTADAYIDRAYLHAAQRDLAFS